MSNLIGLLAVCGMAALALSVLAADGPLIIAHRGASGHRPEHTLAAYDLAISMGADYVEPDLVATRDGVLICRHDCELGGTTDVAAKFPERKKRRIIDGRTVEDWFAEDFTLAEIRTLRARERLPFRNQDHDGKYEVPTFEDLLRFVKRKNAELGRTIGIVPELKHSTYHELIGKPLEKPFLQLLESYGYRGKDAACIIQSFEIGNLKALSKQTKVRLLQLLEGANMQPADVAAMGGDLRYRDMITSDGLKQISTYAWGIGPAKELVLPRDQDNRLLPATKLIEDAHNAGLKVIAYTFRDEAKYLPKDYQSEPRLEYRRWRDLGVDGLFTDFPDTAVAALREIK